MRPVNLVPQDQRRRVRAEGTGRGAHVLLALLAILLGLAVSYVLTANKVTERKNEAAAVSAEADRLEAEAAERTAYTDFTQIAQTRLQSVAAVAGTRFDWERVMREVSLIMPAGSWLQSANASVVDTAGTGATAAPTGTASGTAAAAPTANFTGCTPNQEDAARIMVRMREMHRVEDVKLNGSTQEQAGAPATVDSCGRLYTFDVTVTFSPARPATDRPRGATRVPASLGGGS
jgi:Tfp pilus assembly protein PilN